MKSFGPKLAILGSIYILNQMTLLINQREPPKDLDNLHQCMGQVWIFVVRGLNHYVVKERQKRVGLLLEDSYAP